VLTKFRSIGQSGCWLPGELYRRAHYPDLAHTRIDCIGKDFAHCALRIIHNFVETAYRRSRDAGSAELRSPILQDVRAENLPPETIRAGPGFSPACCLWRNPDLVQLLAQRRREDPDPAKAEQYARWHELRKLRNAQGQKAN